jgi:ParB family chromosome partitioning protein
MENEQIQNILLTLVDPPTEADRDSIDPNKIIELAESIRAEGQKQAILLRPMNGRYEIVYGHRRYLAHCHLGMTHIKAIVKEMDDLEMGITRVIENLQRENLSPIEEAKAYRRFRDKYNLSISETAQKLGLSKSTIKDRLRLLTYPPDFQKAIGSGEIALCVADILAVIEDDRMRSYFLRMAVDNGVTELVAKMWVRDYMASLQGSFFETAPGSPPAAAIYESKPQYVTCELCHGPVDLLKSKSIIVCIPCFQETKKAGHA